MTRVKSPPDLTNSVRNLWTKQRIVGTVKWLNLGKIGKASCGRLSNHGSDAMFCDKDPF